VGAYVHEAGFFQPDGVHEGIHDAPEIVRGGYIVRRGGKAVELQVVLSGAVIHAVFIGDAWRQWLKDSSILRMEKR